MARCICNMPVSFPPQQNTDMYYTCGLELLCMINSAKFSQCHLLGVCLGMSLLNLEVSTNVYTFAPNTVCSATKLYVQYMCMCILCVFPNVAVVKWLINVQCVRRVSCSAPVESQQSPGHSRQRRSQRWPWWSQTQTPTPTDHPTWSGDRAAPVGGWPEPDPETKNTCTSKTKSVCYSHRDQK